MKFHVIMFQSLLFFLQNDSLGLLEDLKASESFIQNETGAEIVKV